MIILKVAREKGQILYKGTTIRMTEGFSSETKKTSKIKIFSRHTKAERIHFQQPILPGILNKVLNTGEGKCYQKIGIHTKK